ncbi:MAG: hypothetical protein B6I31_04840 [Desulfobacteraceae bacterium 4572_19]|nr:MAG: hypothetical protein B6I31_04840 [Desulfobacteraceae bacterium 4572_19]
MITSEIMPTFAIVGCGKVGTALSVNLGKAGYRLTGFSCTTDSSAKRAARITGCKNFSLKPWEISQGTDIVFITTPDTAIGKVYSEITAQNGFSENTVVLHCSGALSSNILKPISKPISTSMSKSMSKPGNDSENIYKGSMHPLQSFVSLNHSQNPFSGIVMSVEGDEKSINICRSIAKALGSVFIQIETDSKILYHAAAVTASNYLVTLLDLSFKLIEKAGVAEKDAFKVLGPLINGTLSNVEKVGVRKALTGPIARGDVDVVSEHLKSMEIKTPELVELYKILGLNTVKIATEHGLNKSNINSFGELLSCFLLIP